MKKTVVSLFAGAGGLDLGFHESGFEIVLANEIDKYASETYKKNFKNKLIVDSVVNLKENDLPKADLLIGGFPCQPFSIAGYRKGFEDERGELFWQIIRVANVVKPEIIVLENVRNLISHDSGNTYKVIEDTLLKKGYYVKSKVLSSYEFGIPQTRQRIFILAFKNKDLFNKHEWPTPSKKVKSFKKMLVPGIKDEKYYYGNTKYISELEKANKETVVQIRRHYVRENKSNMFPTLTANMGAGGHNVPIIFDAEVNGFRKITPREAFNVQGFPKTFKFPEGMSDARLYKQAGNAVTVNVSKAVAESILKIMEGE